MGSLVKSRRWLIFGGFLLAGCGGNKTEIAKTALLTRAAWKYQKIGFETSKDGYIDVLGSRYADYEKGDVTVFNPDGSGYLRCSDLKYDPADPSALPFNWSFENNAGGLYFEHQHFKVKALSDNNLEIYHDEHIEGEDIRYIIAFGH
jgi:hypothetical protein